jgi:molybdopterin-guanine dinucleotide biosynthesis protein A
MDGAGKLPVHGFVLAGGKSSRMGADKALLELSGRPLIAIAVEKLGKFCAQVSIAGNRDDLEQIAPVVHEPRMECGPAAGVEAGLLACEQSWALFVPVDVPLVPGELLRRWVVEAMRVDIGVSYLGIVQKQPAFCLLRRERAEAFRRLLDGGERRLEVLLNKTAEVDGCASWMYDEYELYAKGEAPSEETLELWFLNANTPEDWAALELAVEQNGTESPGSDRGY